MNSKNRHTDIPEKLMEDLKNYRSVKAHKKKMNQNQQLELMEFIARFSGIDEINKYFITTHGITISFGLISQYKRTPKWRPIIKKLREKYLLDIDEVAGNHKRVRLERAERIYERAMEDGDFSTALKANKHGLDEKVAERKIDDGTPNVTYNNYLVMSDDELRAELEKLTNNFKQPKIMEIKNEG